MIRLLPTATDVSLAIARMDTDTVVRIRNKAMNKHVDYTPANAVQFFNCYSLTVAAVSTKCIILALDSGNEYTVTFHKPVLTQIGIESL